MMPTPDRENGAAVGSAGRPIDVSHEFAHVGPGPTLAGVAARHLLAVCCKLGSLPEVRS